MSSRKKQAGFTAIEIVAVIAIVIGIGFIAIKANEARLQAGERVPKTAQEKGSLSSSLPTITKPADLNRAERALDSLDAVVATSGIDLLDRELLAF